MGLKFGQNIKFQFFFRFLQHSGRDKAFLSRQSLLVATLVATHCFSRHRSRHTACRDIGRDILLVATYFLSRHTFLSRHNFLVATYFLTAACFSSPTCRGHNFFILTRIWACEYSLERYLNVECIHEGI